MAQERTSGVLLWLKAFLILLLGWGLTAGVVHFDRDHRLQLQRQQLTGEVEAAASRLEKNLHALLQLNHAFSARIAGERNAGVARLKAQAENLFSGQRQVTSVTLARDFKVVFVYPDQGNDSILGLNYVSRPEIMAGVNKAIQQRATVLSGPIKLVQNARLGVIGRTPIFTKGQDDKYWGMVSVAIDLESLLEEAGLAGPSARFQLTLRGREGSGTQGDVFYGDRELFTRSHIGRDIPIPGGHWRLAAVAAAPALADTQDSLRRWLMRGFGILITLAVLGLMLLRHRRYGPELHVTENSQLPGVQTRDTQGKVSLRMFLMGSLMLVFLPIVAITGWASYRNAEQATEQFTYAMASEVGERIQDRVLAFFDIPRRVAAFNQEHAASGLLGEAQRTDLMQKLLLQIRQQPLLTFVSIGMADGEYFAGSRPPLGIDQGLRVLYARTADQRKMHIYRVDDNGQATSLLFKSDNRFDARQRPWYTAASSRQGLAWYPAYRYAVHDDAGAYETMGIGVSAPLFNPLGKFIGVTTADVALSQLGQFLGELTAKSGGIAFIAESGGELLASSTPEPIYHLVDGKAVRIPLSASDNPLLRIAGETLKSSGQPEGSTFAGISGERHLLKWQSHQLPEGPLLTVGVLLPKAHFAAVASGMLRNIIYLALAVALFSLLIALFVSNWIARPLRALSLSSVSLAAGHWPTSAPKFSPIQEVATLFASMEDMAQRVKAHSENLERRVAERTQALAEAHRHLTDSIDYARLIQNAILPEQQLTDEMGDRHFVLWLPRDVVGGDFYFYRSDAHSQLFGVIDCAGHGVPGACMTMAAHAALEVATQNVAWNDPARLLLHTDAVVRNMLPLDNRIVASIDAAFCHYETGAGMLTFAGAHQSLFWTDGAIFEEIPGGRRSLNDRKRSTYTNLTRSVAPTHTYYLLSDGLLDQAGGKEGGSFGTKRFREWAVQQAHLPLPEQRQSLIETINRYRGDLPQRDDITVFAFRLMQ